jgi:phosphate-selective porin OprO/OprP
VSGGRLTDYTVGVNWYWNAYTKMEFNWVHAVSDLPVRDTAHSDLFGLRAQIDF